MLIIFDLDDTLITTTDSISCFRLRRALEEMRQAGLQMEEESLAEELMDRIDRYARDGLMALEEFVYLHEATCPERYIEIGKRVLLDPKLDGEVVSCFHGVETDLILLAEKAHLAMVTRGDEGYQKEKMKSAKLPLHLFHRIAIVPDSKKEVYQQLIEEFCLPLHRVFVVGDRIEQDLLPAKELGCVCVWISQGRFQVKNPLFVDYQIETLGELLPLLEGIC